MPVKVTAIKSQDVRRVPREDRPRALMNQARNGRVSKQAIFQLSKQGKQSESFMDAGIMDKPLPKPFRLDIFCFPEYSPGLKTF